MNLQTVSLFRFSAITVLSVFLWIALTGTMPSRPTPYGAVAAISDDSITVVLRTETMPKLGHDALLYVFGPGEQHKKVGTVAETIGNQVTVNLTAPFIPPSDKFMVLFESDRFPTWIKPSIHNPEPIRHPLPATVPAEHELIRATTSGDLNTVESVLHEMINMDAGGPDGGWPLAIAAQRGYLNIMKRLLQAGADPNLIDQKTGLTPLKLAASWGQTEAAKLLLKRGADVNFQGPMNIKWNNGWSPLHQAASGEHVEVVDVLLENDAKIGVLDVQGATPLMRAAENGAFEGCKRLISAGADVRKRSKSGATSLMQAATADSLATLGLLIDHGAQLDAQLPEESILPKHLWGATALMIASEREKHADEVALLIMAGANPALKTLEGKTAADFAARAPDTWTREIFSHSDSPQKAARTKLETRLAFDVYNGKPEDVRAIVKLGIGPDLLTDTGRSLLGLATGAGNTETVKVLLDLGANPNFPNAVGDIALHTAAKKGRLEIFKIILEAGGNAILMNKVGQKPLDLAPKKKRSQFQDAVLNTRPSP